jgi:uncharacterized protein (TIGR00304 family)
LVNELSEVAAAGLINYYEQTCPIIRKFRRRLKVAVDDGIFEALPLPDMSLADIGFILIVVGFVLAFLAIVVSAVRARGRPGATRGGGVLLIGPIPIVFGTDRESVKLLMVLAILLIVVFLVFMFVPTLLLSR